MSQQKPGFSRNSLVGLLEKTSIFQKKVYFNRVSGMFEFFRGNVWFKSK